MNFLHATYPDKEIQVVETAWNYQYGPEENGNGPSHSVMNGWLNRGLWDNATHRLNATEILQTFKKWAE